MIEKYFSARNQTIIIPTEGLSAALEGFKFPMLYKRLIKHGVSRKDASRACTIVFNEVMAVHALRMKAIDNNLILKKGKRK